MGIPAGVKPLFMLAIVLVPVLGRAECEVSGTPSVVVIQNGLIAMRVAATIGYSVFSVTTSAPDALEYINNYDPGVMMQTAYWTADGTYSGGNARPEGERNPTEAGWKGDAPFLRNGILAGRVPADYYKVGKHLYSKMGAYYADKNNFTMSNTGRWGVPWQCVSRGGTTIETEVYQNDFLNPNDFTAPKRLRKRIELNALGDPRLGRWVTTIVLDKPSQYVSLEGVTAYLMPEFTNKYRQDLATGNLIWLNQYDTNTTDAAGEPAHAWGFWGHDGVIKSIAGDTQAMGIFVYKKTVREPSGRTYSHNIYNEPLGSNGRFSLNSYIENFQHDPNFTTSGPINKISAFAEIGLLPDETSIPAATEYTVESYFAVGTRDQVASSLRNAYLNLTR